MKIDAYLKVIRKLKGIPLSPSWIVVDYEAFLMEKQLQEEREQRQQLEEVRATQGMMKQFMSQRQSRTSSDDR
ncbi:hypothetical protein OROHE_022899 [Orobanche hederae]